MSDVVVVGLGYVGLPLAAGACAAGLQTEGLDVDPSIVSGLNSGRSHVDDLDDADIADMLEQGFTAHADPKIVADADVVIICVPTPLRVDGAPDLTAVESAVTAVAPHIARGTLVVLESTTYPGTTTEIVRPMLEKGSALAVGTDIHLAFSPERIDPGNKEYGLRNTPKIVGGETEACARAAEVFYRRVVDQVVIAKGTREAEAAKLLENTYRHVNIALVNEMLRFFHELGIDFWDVIRLASTKPFGFQTFYPGPGVGGHCIPIDPNYLSYRVRTQLGYGFRFVELAQEINATMPAYVARRVQEQLNDKSKALRGSKVLILGVTYKPNISDRRESPAVAVAAALQAQGAVVLYHDPHVRDWEVEGVLRASDEIYGAAANVDIVVLLQNHQEYNVDAIADCAADFLDTRGVLRSANGIRL